MPIPRRLTEPEPMTGRFGRSLRELRISVIERCNFRCTCRIPADSLQGRGVFLPLEQVLTDPTADGVWYSCLFSDHGTDLMPLLRHGTDPSESRSRILSVWSGRDDRYSEKRGEPGQKRLKVEMFRMGG